MTPSERSINIARLMPADLPQYVEPLRLARRQARIAGTFPVTAMPRLLASVQEDHGEVEFELEFSRDDNGLHSMAVRIATRVTLLCQRCLQPVQVPVAANIRLGLVQGSEQARLLPAEFEPLEVGDEPLLLMELIEDEVLLALPFAPLHPSDQCPSAVLPEAGTKPSQARHKPFGDLIELKQRRKNQ